MIFLKKIIKKFVNKEPALLQIKTNAEEHYSFGLQNSSILLFLMSLRPKTTKIDLIQFEASTVDPHNQKKGEMAGLTDKNHHHLH